MPIKKILKNYLEENLGRDFSTEQRQALFNQFYDNIYNEVLYDWHENIFGKVLEAEEIFHKQSSWDSI